jgi:hypothetical protein
MMLVLRLLRLGVKVLVTTQVYKVILNSSSK